MPASAGDSFVFQLSFAGDLAWVELANQGRVSCIHLADNLFHLGNFPSEQLIWTSVNFAIRSVYADRGHPRLLQILGKLLSFWQSNDQQSRSRALDTTAATDLDRIPVLVRF